MKNIYSGWQGDDLITSEQLTDGFTLNLRIIQMQVQDLTQADTLTRTPYNINSMNWVLGHLAVNRDRVLTLLKEQPLLTEAETSRYKSESEAVFEDSEGIIPLERLMELLQQGQDKINAALAPLTQDELAQDVQSGEDQEALGSRLFGLYFHDTYHTGQTDLLRQVAGKNDKII